jgi:hypothetical protein
MQKTRALQSDRQSFATTPEDITMKLLAFPFLTLLLTAVSALAQQKTVTIAVVNNPDMIELKKLSLLESPQSYL